MSAEASAKETAETSANTTAVALEDTLNLEDDLNLEGEEEGDPTDGMDDRDAEISRLKAQLLELERKSETSSPPPSLSPPPPPPPAEIEALAATAAPTTTKRRRRKRRSPPPAAADVPLAPPNASPAAAAAAAVGAAELPGGARVRAGGRVSVLGVDFAAAERAAVGRAAGHRLRAPPPAAARRGRAGGARQKRARTLADMKATAAPRKAASFVPSTALGGGERAERARGQPPR